MDSKQIKKFAKLLWPFYFNNHHLIEMIETRDLDKANFIRSLVNKYTPYEVNYITNIYETLEQHNQGNSNINKRKAIRMYDKYHVALSKAILKWEFPDNYQDKSLFTTRPNVNLHKNHKYFTSSREDQYKELVIRGFTNVAYFIATNKARGYIVASLMFDIALPEIVKTEREAKRINRFWGLEDLTIATNLKDFKPVYYKLNR